MQNLPFFVLATLIMCAPAMRITHPASHLFRHTSIRRLLQVAQPDPLDAVNNFIQRISYDLAVGSQSPFSTTEATVLPPAMVIIPKQFSTSYSNSNGVDSVDSQTQGTLSSSVNPTQPMYPTQYSNNGYSSASSPTKGPTNDTAVAGSSSTQVQDPTSNKSQQTLPTETTSQPIQQPSSNPVSVDNCELYDGSTCIKCRQFAVALDSNRCVIIPTGCRTYDLPSSLCLRCDDGLTLTKGECK